MLNRSAIIIKYKKPFVDWVNSSDPRKSSNVELSELNQDNNIYLIEIEEEHERKKWIKANHVVLLEHELYDWYTDPALWPKIRNLKLFNKFFSVEFHAVIFDTGTTPLEEDEF